MEPKIHGIHKNQTYMGSEVLNQTYMGYTRTKHTWDTHGTKHTWDLKY